MKKLTLRFFIIASVAYGIGTAYWAYELTKAFVAGDALISETWTFLAVLAIWVKLLDLTALAVVENKKDKSEWTEYVAQEPLKRSLYALLSIAFLVISPLLFVVGMIFSIEISVALYWTIPLPTVVFLYLALFGRKPDLRPLLDLFV